MNMEDRDYVINKLLEQLSELGVWFTTKNDPTWEEASSYYELDQYGDLTEKSMDKIYKEITDKLGDGAVELEDAISIWIQEALSEYKLSYLECLVTEFEPKPVVDNIEAYPVKLDENYKTRLKEENNKSLNLISAMINDPDFDSESEDGQIVLKTSELFNKLSDKGYDVQVTFDNGESQSSILFGQQGGTVNITITKGNMDLKAFASGNFELSDDNLNSFKDIQEICNEI